jgi:site-specific DNA-methyltransferase (adenine-specific)
MNKLIHGDSAKELKKLADNSVDLLVTDPPYGYGFMGKDWDKAVPSVKIWRECLRVLKPGAFAFVMSAPRQDVLSHMIVRIGDAGFDTDYTSIYWTYASGFPKAMDIGKMADKRQGAAREVVSRILHRKQSSSGGILNRTDTPRFKTIDKPATEAAKALDGSYGGFQPKPAVEVIIVAMKPLSEKTYVDQALKNGKGVTWLDDCRLPTSENVGTHCGNRDENGRCKGHKNAGRSTSGETVHAQETDGTQGRFPANLLVSDDVLNDGRVTKSTGGTGSYSRYFDLDAWAKTLPFLITPKASKGEKNEGLDDCRMKGRPLGISHQWKGQTNGNGEVMGPSEPQANHHPTVKPLKLMSYLIVLGSRPGDIVLEPFAGSGTTCLAARNLGRNYIGIEREAEYVKIAKARLKSAPPVQPTLIAAE